ncbi:MAG TPA: phosphatase PAP2 family protein [Gemmatimonadaceae bacterium]|nr:phosphatase PAP2 family protein [Gemmatimonadaceae bacterium]
MLLKGGMALNFRLFAILVVCGIAAPLGAQESTLNLALAPDEAGDQVVGKPAGPPPTPEHTGVVATLKDLVTDVKNLPSMENLLWVSVGGGAALAVHPADSHVNPTLMNQSWAHPVFVAGAYLGQSYTLLPVAATIYIVGRAKDNKKVSHIGSDLLQSVAIAEGMTQALKYTVRRERPDGSGPNSFPSGHAADTFAFATALERHFGWKLYGPAYIFASYVAASRLHDNVHYLSDVVFGASIGIIAGRTVTRPGHELPIAVTAVPGGAAIVYIRHGE